MALPGLGTVAMREKSGTLGSHRARVVMNLVSCQSRPGLRRDCQPDHWGPESGSEGGHD